jgi:hypothetical protein
MKWVVTPAVIAGMADVATVVYRADVKMVRKAMHKPEAAFVLDLSVPVLHQGVRPL